MSKVPCGGFYLDNNFLGMNENGELSLLGGGSEGDKFKQLVTDGEGKVKWEDRLAYDDSVTVIVNSGIQFAKVSDEVPSWVSANAPIRIWESSGKVTSQNCTDLGNGSFAATEHVFFIMTDNVNIEFAGSLVFPKKGVYFLKMGDGYVSGIASADSDTPEITWDGSLLVKKLDQKFIPDIPAEKLPDIPAEKLPDIPAEKLPDIPAEKLPDIPVIEFLSSIATSIGQSSQPLYNVKDLKYSDILSIFNGKNFVIKDRISCYTPLNFTVEDDGTLFVKVLVIYIDQSQNLIYATLACNKGQNYFYRSSYRTITST